MTKRSSSDELSTRVQRWWGPELYLLIERRYTILRCFVLGEADPYEGRELCLGMLSVLVDLRSPVLPERKPVLD